MFAQKCKSCSKQFNWLKVIRSVGFNSNLQCDECKARYYMNNTSRIIIFLLILLPLPFEASITNIFHSYSIPIYLAWCVVVLCISTVFVKFKSAE